MTEPFDAQAIRERQEKRRIYRIRACTVWDIGCEADADLTAALSDVARLFSESEARREQLFKCSEERRAEWIRAENAEADVARLTQRVEQLEGALRFIANCQHTHQCAMCEAQVSVVLA